MKLSKSDRAFIRRVKRELVQEVREILADVLTEEARLVMLSVAARGTEQRVQ